MIRILTTGNWTSDQVNVTWQPDSRSRLPEVDRLIDETWFAALARPGIKLFDGPMCRLESWHADRHSLQLALSPTSYKVFLGTNLMNPKLADVHGPNVLANPVGVSAALQSADQFLVMGKRNSRVAYYPNRIHPFAGALEPADAGDFFAAARRELAEEVRLTPADLASMTCIGIVEDPALRQPELIMRAISTRTCKEIQQMVDAAEHCGSWSISANADAVRNAIRDPQLTPVAQGTLLLWEKVSGQR